MLRDERLQARAGTLRREILGGAAWLDAHYLSDGGMAAKSLRAYAKAFGLFPQRVLEDRRRVLLTLIMWISPALASDIFQKQAAKRLEKLHPWQKQHDELSVLLSQDVL